MLAIGPLIPDFQYATKVPHPDGADYHGLQKANGKYIAVTPGGTVEERDVLGAWERFRALGNFSVTDLRGTEWADSPVYAFPVAQ